MATTSGPEHSEPAIDTASDDNGEWELSLWDSLLLSGMSGSGKSVHRRPTTPVPTWLTARDVSPTSDRRAVA